MDDAFLKFKSKIALGMIGMLRVAILNHKKEHRGRYPNEIVLHPIHYEALVQELINMGILTEEQISLKDKKFMGVPISVYSFQREALLLDFHNDPHLL